MVLEFKVDVSEEKTVPILRVNGEIDIYTCPKLSKYLKDALDKGAGNLILNLENVHYIDSTGLGAIAHSANSLYKQGGKMHVVCTKSQLKKVFEVSGLSRKNIHLFEEETSALNTL